MRHNHAYICLDQYNPSSEKNINVWKNAIIYLRLSVVLEAGSSMNRVPYKAARAIPINVHIGKSITNLTTLSTKFAYFSEIPPKIGAGINMAIPHY